MPGTFALMTGGARRDRHALGFFNNHPGYAGFTVFCRFVARCLVTLFGARLHWGKYFPVAGDDIAPALDPERLLRVRDACQSCDPNGVFRSEFARVLGAFDGTAVTGSAAPSQSE